MAKFIIKRLLLGLLTLFLVSVVVFAATQALPGNAATAILGLQGGASGPAVVQRYFNEKG